MERPGICLTLNGSDNGENVRLLERHRDLIDLAEVRLDLMGGDFSADGYGAVPLILTCRKKRDGGAFVNDDALFVAEILSALDPRFDFVDVDIDTDAAFDFEIRERAKECGCRIIRSLHDFCGVPDDFPDRLNNARRSGSDVLKGAFMARNSADLLKFWRLAERVRGDRVLFCMGEFGEMSRVLARRLGSLWSYASPEGEGRVAPGQLTPQELRETFRYAEIGEKTRFFAIIGDPVAHSRSPEVHNGAYRRMGCDAAYLRFRVDDPEPFFALADQIPLGGFSVTMPHKERVRDFLSVGSCGVKRIGACNTVIRLPGDSGGDSGWRGENSDAHGFLEALKEILPNRSLDSLNGCKTALIGAGGAARAALYALAEHGADVCVFNRTEERGKRLADAFGCRSAGLDAADLIREHSALIVQASGAGMEPHADVDPLAAYEFRGDERLFEQIYSPAETAVLRRAKAAGIPAVNGYAMLEKQAERQIELFLESPYT